MGDSPSHHSFLYLNPRTNKVNHVIFNEDDSPFKDAMVNQPSKLGTIHSLPPFHSQYSANLSTDSISISSSKISFSTTIVLILSPYSHAILFSATLSLSFPTKSTQIPSLPLFSPTQQSSPYSTTILRHSSLSSPPYSSALNTKSDPLSSLPCYPITYYHRHSKPPSKPSPNPISSSPCPPHPFPLPIIAATINDPNTITRSSPLFHSSYLIHPILSCSFATLYQSSSPYILHTNSQATLSTPSFSSSFLHYRTPSPYLQASKSPDWRQAMEAEYQALLHQKT